MEALNAADWVIVTVIGLSMLLSLLRGFVREALSLIGWVVAFLVSLVFAERFASLLATSIANPTGRYIVAFAALFALTLIAAALLGRLLRSLVEFAGLGALDRLLGMGFGFARGVFVLLAAIVVLRPVLRLDSYPWWGESRLLPHLLLLEGWFQEVTGMARAFLAGLGH